jgi:threonine/homoserine/homoserine lactone efflux protein
MLALVAFAFVSSVTPGPNNVVLWASGVHFGFRATLPHVLGTALGIGLLAAGAAIGVVAVVTAIPGSELTLKVAGTAYLACLAYRVATSGGVERGQAARPLGLGQAVVFQFLNPKAWLFALAAVSTYRLGGVPVAVGSAIVVLAMMAVVVPTAAVWAAGGTTLRPLVADPRRHRILSVALAALLAATIALIWL